MKKTHYLLLVFGWLFTFNLLAQEKIEQQNKYKNNFELGLGLGLSHPHEYAATAFFHLDLNYHFHNFTFGWSYHQHLFGIGKDIFNPELSPLQYFPRINKRLHNIIAPKAFIDFSPIIRDFRPILGVGVGYFFRSERIWEQLDKNDNLIATSILRKDYIPGLVIRMGARYRRFTTHIELNFVPNSNNAYGLANHVSFILVRKFGLDKDYFSEKVKDNKDFYKRRAFFRWNWGFLCRYPVSQKYKSPAFSWFSEIRFRTNGKIEPGIRYEGFGSSNGGDPSLTRFVENAQRPYIQTDNATSKISTYQLKLVWLFLIEKRLSLHFDVGAGLFDIRNTRFTRSGNNFIPPILPSRQVPGGSLTLGYQYGPLLGHISLNFAPTYVPVVFNIGMGYSFSLKIRKKGERIWKILKPRRNSRD